MIDRSPNILAGAALDGVARARASVTPIDGLHSDLPPCGANDRHLSLLSIQRVAEIFGRSRRTVRLWISIGRLPAVRIGRTPFVPIEALDRTARGPHRPDAVCAD